MQIPDCAVHYHLADKQPFLNLSDLAETELASVISDLACRQAESGLKRSFGPRYMEMRRLTETRLFALFVEAGGKPERSAPHYFCLGACEWFRCLAPDMRQVAIPLSALPDGVTSFTYPDSFVAMGFGPRFGLPQMARPYHNQAFRMSQLSEVIRQFGLPSGDADEDYEGYRYRPFEKFIEIQVWSDDPIEPFRWRAGVSG
ncbi:MAG TPA: hypothetical protein VHV51_20180 [Polyangiaceae bacterium]|jgi:hypothetical protein|nr:hypothetical protein [Polyangiaceae bacterium]